MTEKRKEIVFAVCCLVVLVGWFGAASASPFTSAVVYTWRDFDNNDDDANIRNTDLTFAEYSVPGITGRARTEYGVNHAYGSRDDLHGVTAQSLWSDGFIVTGGNGVVDLSVTLNGSTAGNWGGILYGLYRSNLPFAAADFDTDLADASLPNASRLVFLLHDDVVGLLPVGPYSTTFTLRLPYESGAAFYLASVLEATGASGGTADFYDSAHFGITVSSGATLDTLSDTAYAAAVPEPQTYALLLAGLALLAFSARRRKSIGL